MNDPRGYRVREGRTLGTARPVTGGVVIISNVLTNTGQTSLTDGISIPFDATIHVQVHSEVAIPIDADSWNINQTMTMEILDGITVVRSKTASFLGQNSATTRYFVFPINTITTLARGSYTLRFRFVDENADPVNSNYEVSYVLVLKPSVDLELMQ